MVKRQWTPTKPGFDSSNMRYDLSGSLYPDREIGADEEEDRQLVPSPGVVARSGFAARAAIADS